MLKQLFKKQSLISAISVFCVSLLLLMSTQSYAADGAELYTAKGCGACHGADGNSPIMGSYPKVAGQNTDYLIQQLKDIKSGARKNGQSAVMVGIMAAISDEEIAEISKYLSTL